MTAVLDLPETILDSTEELSILGPNSNGMLMSKAEYMDINDCDRGYRYELVHGVVIVSPPPSEGERDPNGELEFLLRDYQRRHPSGGRVDLTLAEQELETESGIRRADRLIWIGLGRTPVPLKDIPAIVIEFVSDTTRDRRRDYEEKRREYREIGVKEYWIIDRFRRTMTVCTTAESMQVLRRTAIYSTPLLPGLELNLDAIFTLTDRWTK